jgi:hydroxyethylthiazole kinase
MIEEAAKIIDLVKEQNPLVDCITNYVTINDCANILLAFGASPAMCDALDESYDFAGISGALYINLGGASKEQRAAAIEGSLAARRQGRPVIVDPVGCGAIRRRIGVLDHLHEIAGIDIIKGNMGEIMALAGMDAGVKGVDSQGDIPGIDDAVVKTARKYNCTVAATGKTDRISDGSRIARISNGVEMLRLVTGAGCMAGALCGATAAAAHAAGAGSGSGGSRPDRNAMFAAAIAAIASMGIAGEFAWEKAKLPSSFRTALIDSVYTITGSVFAGKARVSC